MDECDLDSNEDSEDYSREQVINSSVKSSSSKYLKGLKINK